MHYKRLTIYQQVRYQHQENLRVRKLHEILLAWLLRDIYSGGFRGGRSRRSPPPPPTSSIDYVSNPILYQNA